MIVFISLWSPLIHLIRLWLLPEGYEYTFVQGRDPSGWIWAIESPQYGYLSNIVLEKDVSVFQRADALAHIFVPYGWLAQALGISGAAMLIFIEVLWNALAAYATYRFFRVFFKREEVAVTALILTYFVAGISGIIVGFNWLGTGLGTGTWSIGAALSGWSGEHHVRSFELYEGNQLVTITSLNRSYYMMARFFGLFALIRLAEAAVETDPSRRTAALAFSAAHLFWATLIHPASGQLYVVMTLLYVAMQAVSATEHRFATARRLLTPLLGFAAAAALWLMYQRLWSDNRSVAQYSQQFYNAEPVALWTAMLPMLAVSLWLSMAFPSARTVCVAVTAIGMAATVGLSEFFISTPSVAVRALLLSASLIGALGLLYGKRAYFFSLLAAQGGWQPTVFMGLSFIVITAIAISPHHDIQRVIDAGQLSFGTLTDVIQRILSAGNLVYAARYKLGIWVPLAGLTAGLIYAVLPKRLIPAVVAALVMLSLPSLFLYTWRWIHAETYSGVIRKADAEVIAALKNLSGDRVMCSVQSGFYITAVAHKRTLLGYGEDRVEEKGNAFKAFYAAESDSVRGRILEKYHIDYIYLSAYERQAGGNEKQLESYPVSIESGEVKLYDVRRKITQTTTSSSH